MGRRVRSGIGYRREMTKCPTLDGKQPRRNATRLLGCVTSWWKVLYDGKTYTKGIDMTSKCIGAIITVITTGISSFIAYYMSHGILITVVGAIIGVSIGLIIVFGGDYLMEWLCKRLSHDIRIKCVALWLRQTADQITISIRFDLFNVSRFQFRSKNYRAKLFLGNIRSDEYLIGRTTHQKSDAGVTFEDIPPKQKQIEPAIVCFTFTINKTQMQSDFFTLSTTLEYETTFGLVSIPINKEILASERYKDDRKKILEKLQEDEIEIARAIREDEQREQKIKEHFQDIYSNCIFPLCSVNYRCYKNENRITMSLVIGDGTILLPEPTNSQGYWKYFYSHIKDKSYTNLKTELENIIKNKDIYNKEPDKRNVIANEINNRLKKIQKLARELKEQFNITNNMDGKCEVEMRLWQSTDTK